MKSFEAVLKESLATVESGKPINIIDIISNQLGENPSIVRKGIKQGQFKINGSVIFKTEIVILPGRKIEFGRHIIESPRRNSLPIDKFIKEVIKELGIESSINIPIDKRPAFCAFIVEYFFKFNYGSVELNGSEYLDIIFSELENYFRDNFKSSKETRQPRRRELIEHLVNLRSEKLAELSGLVENLINGIYNSNLYRFLQEYTRIASSPIFSLCVPPLISNSIWSRAAVEALLKPIQYAQQKQEIDKKFEHYQNVKELYLSYSRLIDDTSSIHARVYKPTVEYLFSFLKKECDTSESRSAIISIKPSPRKYNFRDAGEAIFADLLLVIENSGDGLARDIIIRPTNSDFEFAPVSVGILKPLEKRNLVITARISLHDKFEAVLEVNCEWADTSSDLSNVIQSIKFQQQDQQVPWDELEYSKPYSIQEIDEKDKLYGRDEILNELMFNIKSNKIESYKIWGQKRVGKSSIVKTLKTLLSGEQKTIVVWRKISGLKNTDPEKTLNSLGESLCSEIFEEIDCKLQDTPNYDKLRDVEVPNFDGSLYPLEEYIRKLRRIDRALKFVFILDEFDGINSEFFLPGALGDTLSQNMGKGLNESNYVGFILVGSENMHLLDKQIMNYNGFKELEVDTFDRENHFGSFINIIKGPVAPHINYSVESVERIFNVTNGNPYFANLICLNILKICLKNRDNEVHINTTDKAIDLIVNSSQKSHFDHFWSDGINEESNIKKERKTDIRRRVLISYSFLFSVAREFPTRADISRKFDKPGHPEYQIEQYEIDNTITEFFNRKIFSEEPNGVVRIKPRLFESWLCGPGRTLMTEGISDLEALQREKILENEMILKLEELRRINEKLIFRGHKLGVPVFEKYFMQFGSPIEQRRVFNIIDSILYISKEEIINFFRREQKNIFGSADRKLALGVKSFFRDGVELFAFKSTIAENVELLELFKKISSIRSQRVVKDISNHRNIGRQEEFQDLVIFDSIVDDVSRIQNELLSFISDHSIKEGTRIKLVVVLIGIKAKADLIKLTSAFPMFSLVYYKEIDDSQIKPFIETTQLFETRQMANYAYTEVRKHFNAVSKDSLNVLFEVLCPGRSLPILWSKSTNFTPLFPNEFAVTQTQNEVNEGEELRARLFKANTQLSQKLNSFIISHLANKAKKKGKEWFSIGYVPAKNMTQIHQRWIDDEQKNPKESYLDFIHYKEIIKMNKELLSIFQIGSKSLEWCERLNVLRRDFAHAERPAPVKEDVEFFESTTEELLKRMDRELSNPTILLPS